MMSNRISLLIWLLPLLAACSKMDDTYRDFIRDGERVYVGKADSVTLHPGENRILLTWLAISDPKIAFAKVYWNNRTDSAQVAIDKTKGIDTVRLLLSDMEEGDYSFDIITYDTKGNSSIAINAAGRVYGEVYQRSLLVRPVREVAFQAGKATISWGVAAEGAIGTEIEYTDRSGVARIARSGVDSDTTQIGDYRRGASFPFRYRTLFMPDTLAIDTFYTAWNEMTVAIPPLEFDKSSWSITPSSEDVKGGRLAVNAIDNDPGTIWVNEIVSGNTYPHWLQVDMGEEMEASGFTFNQRFPLVSPLKVVELEISKDNLSWESVGEFTLEQTGDKQYLPLTEAASFRYFRVTMKSSYNAQAPNASLAEVGVYE